MIRLQLEDTRCPSCSAPALVCAAGDVFGEESIHENGVRCQKCDVGFDVIWGVPFLGQFAPSDILSLIEIASNADNYSRKANAHEQDPQENGGIDYAGWQDLLEGYHLCSDREAYLSAHGITPQIAAWFPNRYAEHIYFRALTSSLGLQGKRVLDVGAGPGFDSYKFVKAGSIVTCLEFSPILAHEGLRKVRGARWFCGNSNALPFTGGAFDLVVANAALHHMQDIPRAIEEMLRVLRPGGCMMTLCDSYRKTGSSEQVELDVFKNDPAVLMGVNEGIPPFGEFVSALSKHRDCLDIEVITSEVHGLQYDRTAKGLKLPRVLKRSLPFPRQWSFDEALDFLPNTSGGLALRVRLKKPISDSPAAKIVGTIKPADFARALDSQSHGIATLAAYVPRSYVDLPLLGMEHAKFRLLNGWKPPESGLSYRTALGRGRSFHMYCGGDSAIRVKVLLPHINRSDKPEIVLQVNGVAVGKRRLCRGLWTEIVAPVDAISPGSVAAVEIRLETTLPELEGKTFHVRECGFGPLRCEQGTAESDLEQFGLEALAQIGLIGPNHVLVLFSSDYALGVMTINRLRELGIAVRAIVAKEQISFYRSEPGIEISGTYEDKEGMEGDELLGSGRIDLIVAPDLQSAHRLTCLVRSRVAASHCYVVLPGGHVARANPQMLAEVSSRLRRQERVMAFRQLVGALLKRFAWARP